MPLRVAVDLAPLLGQPTGVGTFVAGAVGRLAARPDAVVLLAYGLTWSGRRRLAAVAPPDVDVARVPMPAGLLVRQWTRNDWPAAEWWTGPVDAVHGTNFVVPPARHGAEVVTVHDLTAVRFPELCAPASLRYPELVRRATRRGAFVHTPSAFVAGEVVDWLGLAADRVVAIPHGVDPVTVAPAGVAGRPPTILTLATAEPRKDLPTLVRAFDMVAGARPDARLVLAGAPGWGSEAVAATVAAARHRDRIEQPGWVDPATRAGLLRAATVFAYPSRYEGFGLPPLEAMAAGVPVVASAAGAVPEAVGDAAMLVPVGDADAMAAALGELLDDESCRAGLIARGRARAAAFTWDRTATGLIELYRRAAACR